MMKFFKDINWLISVKLTLKILLVVVAIAGIGCEHEEFSFQEKERKPLMMDMLRLDTSVSMAVQALDKAKMSGALNAYGPFTFFIPNNQGFRKYLKNIGKASLADFTEEEITTLMTYHIIGTRLRSTDFIPGPQPFTTGRGDYITLDISRGIKSDALANGKANLYETDIEYSNGIVHKMDAVLDPPILTIGEFLMQNPQYSVMTAGLRRAGLLDTLVALSNPQGERTKLTLFAETNDVLTAAGITTFDAMPLANLKELMRYHLVPGSSFTSQYSSLTAAVPAIGVVESWGSTLTTLDPSAHIYYDIAIQKPVNATIDFRGSDILMKNGILHNIDKQMVFSAAVPRTQIVHIFSNNLNYAYGINGVSPTAQPLINPTSKFRYFSEPAHPRGSSAMMLSYEGDSAGDSLITVVKNVRKGKYKIVVNYKSGTRGALQMMYGQDKIGTVKNYGASPTYYQNMELDTYEFKTGGDLRLKWVSQASKLVNVAFDVMVMTPVN